MASTTLNENITLKGLDNIKETINLGPIEIKPLSFELKPLNLTSKSEFALTKPIDTNSTSKSDSSSDARLGLRIDPLRVDSDQKSLIDVKPLAMDTCQTVRLAPLPETIIRQPYSHHFGFTVMGFEIWGFNFNGHSGSVIEHPPRPEYRMITVGGGSHHTHGCEQPESKGSAQPRTGLRVRVGNK
jgi:hypothetical protein